MVQDTILSEQEIERSLNKLGFTKNDAKVLLSLFKYKILSPADIAKYSDVDRARVYDSLNRLMEKGYIQKEPVKRGATYQIIPIERIFKSLREKFKQKIEYTVQIEKSINELQIEQEIVEPKVWSISSRKKIRNKMKELINNSEERIFFIITPDLLMDEIGGYDWILKDLWNKKFSKNNIEIVIALKYSKYLEEAIKKLLKIKIKIHAISGVNVIPFGLLIADNDFLLTTLDQVKEAPEYTSGIWLEDGRDNQILGYEHLFNHFLSSCQEIAFKKNNSNENQLFH